MKTNIYWPVYKNIEDEFNKLMFSIHIDNNQLNVYSSKISDLILRAATEIESLSKELYSCNGGTKTGHIKYDEDAIKHLNSQWILEDKEVIISSYNCFLTNRSIFPFKKDELRTGSNRFTYSWNNSYQNLKHDRANSLHYGSIKYLFSVTAALFLLNIYYNDLIFPLGKNSTGSNFDTSIGSSIFNIKIHELQGLHFDGTYSKGVHYSQCTYVLKPTGDIYEQMKEAVKVTSDKAYDLTNQQINAVFSEKAKEGIVLTQEETIEIIKEVQKKNHTENMTKMLKQDQQKLGKLYIDIQYEAILNKNQL